MPSDAKKRDQARKKEAQKKRNQKIMSVNGTDTSKTNGTVTNGEPVEMTEEGLLFKRNINEIFVRLILSIS